MQPSYGMDLFHLRKKLPAINSMNLIFHANVGKFLSHYPSGDLI